MARDNATGLVFRRGILQWTAVRRGRRAPVVTGSKAERLEEKSASAADLAAIAGEQAPAVVAAIRALRGSIRGHLAMGLSSEHALVRVADLPATDPDELRNMAELQVDKFSPWPQESTLFSHEVLSRGDKTATVAIVVARRAPVDAAGKLLMQAGLFPQRVDLETLSWWRLIRDSDGADAAACGFSLLMDVSVCDLIVSLKGIPVVIRSLGKPGDLSERDIRGELESTLTIIETDRGVSEAGSFSLSLWHWGAKPEALVSDLERAFGVVVRARGFESLPPLAEGTARRSMDSESDTLNLAPAGWGEGRRRSRNRKRLFGLAAAVLAVWLGCVGAMVGAVRVQSREAADLDRRLEEMEKTSREARKIRELLHTAGQYADRSRSALECLRAAVAAKPSGLQFQHFEYDNRRGKRVKARGDAISVNLVYDFEKALAASGVFTNVKLDSLVSPPQGKHQFSVVLDLPGAESEKKKNAAEGKEPDETP